MEKCFETNRTPEADKLERALACLTGTSITWWQYSQGRVQIFSWKDFKEKFKTRFHPSRGSSSVDHLMNIVHQGSVDEYRDRFEELSIELPHVSVDVLESAFLRGLKRTSGIKWSDVDRQIWMISWRSQG